jgi:Putative viral replication protein
MPGVGPRAKNWCFTLNNWTPADIDRLSGPLDGVVYLVFGKEVGASGTPHLQGTVCFQSRKRRSQVITIIGQAHFTVTRSLPQSIDYCKKDGDFLEFGLAPQEKNGERTDIEEFKATVKEGVLDLRELREQHSGVVARHPRFVIDYIADHTPKITVNAFPLRDWQSTLYNRLILEPNEREIIFVVDLAGNKGKSWFARYYTDLHENSQIIVPGKKADMAYTVKESNRVFFLDCPRSKQGEFIQYDFLEELKNGYVFSPKYESVVKKLKTPHVVVLMNERPCMQKLSTDRYSITVLN